MKVMVATREGQGLRKNDFCHAEDGEPVGFPTVECDGERVDGSCGCRRSMVGLKSGKSTTTFKVADISDIDEEGLLLILSEQVADYAKLLDMSPYVERDFDSLIKLADTFGDGSILERRGDHIQLRSM